MDVKEEWDMMMAFCMFISINLKFTKICTTLICPSAVDVHVHHPSLKLISLNVQYSSLDMQTLSKHTRTHSVFTFHVTIRSNYPKTSTTKNIFHHNWVRKNKEGWAEKLDANMLLASNSNTAIQWLSAKIWFMALIKTIYIPLCYVWMLVKEESETADASHLR